MNEPDVCTHLQARLPCLMVGDLSPREQAEMEAHLAMCPHCAAEVRRDARLLAALAALPDPEEAPAVTWQQVFASHREASSVARRRRYSSRLALATAGAAIAVGLLAPRFAARVAPPDRSMPPDRLVTAPAAGALAVQETLLEAHTLASAAEIGADPNRAMILLCATRRGGAVR